jgi:hypothetical protein
MGLVKAIVGLCLGIALFSALQAAGLRTLQDYLKSGNANAGLPIGNNPPLVTSFDVDALKNGILPKYGPIDTTEGQRLGVESAARRIDMQIRNAQSHVPRF